MVSPGRECSGLRGSLTGKTWFSASKAGELPGWAKSGKCGDGAKIPKPESGMPIQTAETDKRLPVDERAGLTIPGCYAPGDRALPSSPNPCCQNQGVWERPEYPPASHGVSERKNIPVKFFGWSTLFGVPRSGQLAVWALIDHWPKNSKR